MIQLFKNIEGVTTSVDKPENGTWVNILPPFKQEEFTEVADKLDVPLSSCRIHWILMNGPDLKWPIM